MLVSHEVPISLLEESRKFNSFDYALVHLFESRPVYYNFFVKSILQDREVLLDNSIFELQKAFDRNKFANWIEKLIPTYYVVPDSLENTEETITNFKNWQKEYNNLPGLKIGAVQGKTWQELSDCYKFMSDNADYIAMSFDFSWYQLVGSGKNKLEKQCTGRQHLIQRLMDEGIWNHNKPHHCLGGSLAREFKQYQNILSIRSIDTSSPIMCGIKGISYYGNLGNYTKPTEKLADNIDIILSDDSFELVKYNVRCFQKIVGNLPDSSYL